MHIIFRKITFEIRNICQLFGLFLCRNIQKAVFAPANNRSYTNTYRACTKPHTNANKTRSLCVLARSHVYIQIYTVAYACTHMIARTNTTIFTMSMYLSISHRSVASSFALSCALTLFCLRTHVRLDTTC